MSESSPDTGTDIVKLAGLNSSDVMFSRINNDLLIQITSSGETLKLLHTHYEVDESSGVVTIGFTPDGELQWRGKFHIPMRFDIDDKEFETINREGDACVA